MKKTLALLLALALCLACAPAFAEEVERETFESGDFTYALLGTTARRRSQATMA